MAFTAADAIVKMASITFNSTQLGIGVAAMWQHSPTYVPIRGEGVAGPSAVGLTHDNVFATVEFLAASSKVADGTTGSLVIVMKDTAGDTETHTLTGMKLVGYAFAMDRESVPPRHTMQFQHVGDMGSDPVTIARS
jgi:hypothetical protein